MNHFPFDMVWNDEPIDGLNVELTASTKEKSTAFFEIDY